MLGPIVCIMELVQQYWLGCCLFLSSLFTVFEILLAFLKHKNWELAFYEVIPQRKIEHTSTQHQDSLTDPDGKIEHTSTQHQDSLTDPDGHTSTQDSLTDPNRKIVHTNTQHQDSLTDPDSLPRTQVQSQDETSRDEEEETGPYPPADCKEGSLD